MKSDQFFVLLFRFVAVIVIGYFLKLKSAQMSDEGLIDFISLSERSLCPGAALMLREGQKPASIVFLLEGKAKLSLNSIGGQRLIIGFASPGEILGLTSAVSGSPYEIAAEAHFQCMTSSLRDRALPTFCCALRLRARSGAPAESREQAHFSTIAHVGLMSTVTAKLAKLLLAWCAGVR